MNQQREWQFNQSLNQHLQRGQYKQFEIENAGFYEIYAECISNDLRYIVSGGNQSALKIWDYNDHALIKSIQLDNAIYICKFSDDSKLLYAGTYGNLYQFDANNNFKQTYVDNVHEQFINNLYSITNTIILTTSFDQTIIKTNKKHRFFKSTHTIIIFGDWITTRNLKLQQVVQMMNQQSYGMQLMEALQQTN